MSQTTITKRVYVNGVLADADSVTFSNREATEGVIRTDTGASVVACGTALTKVGTGVYQYTITDPAVDLIYQYWIKAVVGESTVYYDGLVEGGETTGEGEADPGQVPVGGGCTCANVRYRFVVATGRYDLIDNGDLTTNQDNGANWFLNAGQRWLDAHVNAPWMYKRWHWKLLSGAIGINIQRCINVRDIWLVSAASSRRVRLTDNQLTLREFTEVTQNKIADWSTGEPEVWTFNTAALSPEFEGQDGDDFASAGIEDYDDVTFTLAHRYKNIIFYPKADQDYTIIVEGKFWSNLLVDDSDATYWTWNHPELVVLAAQYAHALEMATTASQNALLNALMLQIEQVHRETINHEMTNWDFRVQV